MRNDSVATELVASAKEVAVLLGEILTLTKQPMASSPPLVRFVKAIKAFENADNFGEHLVKQETKVQHHIAG